MGIFLVASASASDLNETDLSEIDEEVISNDGGEELSVEEMVEMEESEILTTYFTPKTSVEIQTSVDSASDGDTIVLDGYYLINSTVNVDKRLNFIGKNNATIDGNNDVRLFYVSNNAVVFRNITFMNGSATDFNDGGGAIYFAGGGSCVNCSFIGNSAKYSGGAVYYGSCVNCRFIGNFANRDGGAMYYGSASNCIFINNSANDDGGAMRHVSATDCIFVGNSACDGGAACVGSFVNCSFIDNEGSNGGALYANSAVNCIFIGNSAGVSGGAAYVVSCANCSFTNNSAQYSGGAIYLDSDDSSCVNCSFANNSAGYMGGGVLISGGNVVECAFDNCSASRGDAIFAYDKNRLNVTNCSFKNCKYYNLNVSAVSDFLIANLSDFKGQLSNKTLIFTINNKTYNFITDSDGLVSIEIKDYLCEPGNHTVIVDFAGDEIQSSFSITVNVNVKRYTSYLTVNVLSVVLGDDGVLTANLTNMWGPLSKRTVIFTYNGTDNPRTTSSSGIASFRINSNETGLGKHVVGVSFGGDDANDPVSVNATVFVSNYRGNLTIVQNGRYYGDTSLTFRLVDCKSNDPIGNAPISLVFSTGESVPLSTDSRGIATYNVLFNPGTYNFTARVTTPNVDVNTIEYNDLIINRIVGEIQLTYDDSTKNLKIRLVNPQNGDVYRNVRVTLEFSNGMPVYVTTNDDGIGIYEIPFSPDTYYVITSVTGDYMEFEIAELDNIVISDMDNSKIIIHDDIVFDYLKSGSTTISVINGHVLRQNIMVIDHPEAVIALSGDEINVSNLTAGTYTLRVVTTPDEGYNSVVGTRPVIVNRIYSSVSFDNNIEFDYLKNGSTTVSVIGGGIGNITIDGNPQGALINLTGNLITVSGLDAGSYTLRVSSNPDSNHKKVDGTVYVSVRKISGGLSVGDVNVNYGQSASLSVAVDGGTLTQSNIKIVGHEEIVPGLNGNMITVSGLDAGTYVISVTSMPDRNHYAATGQANIAVNRIDSKVSIINPIEFSYGGSGYTSVYLEGCSIDVGNISVLDGSGNNVDAKITYANNVIAVSGLAAGSYRLNVVSTPDFNHKPVTESKNVTVSKVASEIKSYNPIMFNYLGVGSTYITVNGGSLSGSKMSVSGHSEAVISYVGNQIRVSNLNPGSYSLRVESIPDANHNADVKYITVTVNKAPVRIEAKSKTVALKKGSWTVRVLDSNNIPVSNMQVTLKVYTGNKFITVTVKTNAKGEATYNTKKLSKGTHKVIASIDHVGYSASPVTSSVKVIKQKVLKFKVKKKISKDGSSLSITVKYKNKPINGVKLKVKVYDGKKLVKTVTLKTKTKGKFKGVAGWGTNKLSVGNHKVVIVPASIQYDGSKSLMMKIKKSAKKFPKWETKI